MTKQPKKAETGPVEVSKEFAAQERIFLKSIVENPNTSISIFGALSPNNLVRVLQEADNGGKLQSRRHNPALFSYLKYAMEHESFPVGALSVLLAKKSDAPYFQKLQNFALDHIESFPHKAELVMNAAVSRSPQNWEFKAADVQKMGDKGARHAIIEAKYKGEAVASEYAPIAKTIKGAREQAFVQFWNAHAKGTLVTPGNTLATDTLEKFRHRPRLSLATKIASIFNDKAADELSNLGKQKGFELKESTTTDVEILGNKGITTTFTLICTEGRMRGKEFTATRFGENAGTASNLAAMSVLAQYGNNTLTPKS